MKKLKSLPYFKIAVITLLVMILIALSNINDKVQYAIYRINNVDSTVEDTNRYLKWNLD